LPYWRSRWDKLDYVDQPFGNLVHRIRYLRTCVRLVIWRVAQRADFGRFTS
jgi:hypothetical protein